MTAEPVTTAPATSIDWSSVVWMSPKRAAIFAARHERTIREALHEYVRSNGKRGLRGEQAGRNCCWRIHRDDLDAWIRGEKPGRRRTLRSAS